MTRFTEEWLATRLKKKPVTKAPSPSKYGNVKTTVDGVTFDSAKESRRWQELLLLQKAGEIHSLERQVRWPIRVNNEFICHYVADFCYYRGQVHQVVEDVKSEATRKIAVYRLKKKLMRAVHFIEIQEV